VVSLLWVAAGLAFYEKTVLVVGLFALVALGWFSTGNTPQRLRGLWDDYRAAVCAFAVLGGGYLACYAVLGLDFSPGGSADVSWGPIAWNLVGLALLPAAVGGPVVWQPLSVGSLADAPEALLVVSWAVAVGVGYAAHRTRTASKRAWALVGFTLLADVALLASARAGIVGPEIGREYRYQTESAAVLVLALGLAFLPLLGAREQNLPRDQAGPPVPAVDDRRLVAAATAVVVVASLVSSVRYVDLWQDRNPTEAYVSHVARALTGSPQQPVELVDDGVPQTLLWSFRYPENTYSHLFRPWERHYTFPREAVDDELHLVDASGDLVPVRLEPARRAVPSRAATGPACPYPAHDGALRVRLDGPVIGDGWWVTVDYTARTEVPLRLTAGDEVHRVTLPAGRHTGWFQAAGTFRDVVLADVPAAAGLCVRALALGSARPAAGGR
jgi:hypothetical protein